MNIKNEPDKVNCDNLPDLCSEINYCYAFGNLCLPI